MFHNVSQSAQEKLRVNKFSKNQKNYKNQSKFEKYSIMNCNWSREGHKLINFI